MPLWKPFDATSFSTRLSEDLNGLSPLWRENEKPLQGAELSWREWLKSYFPYLCSLPLAERHERLYDWFDALERGVTRRPRLEVWPRGGSKSTSGEVGTVRVGVKLSRRFVLYVSETQEQADKHVQAISTLFERVGVERSVNKFGTARGWRRDQLRTANGFNVSGYGMDGGIRGVRMDEFRPDLIIFDDIDGRHDTQATTDKKKAILTESILPAGSSDCAVLFLQNLITENGIVSQLVENRAGFLYNREVSPVEPAILGLETDLEEQEDGSFLYRITGGVPTWAGQSIQTCEEQINTWGLKAFLREAQQEVHGADGYFFNVNALRYCNADEVPPLVRLCRAWDLAATEGGGDWTVGVLMGLARNGVVYILDMKRFQYGSDKVRKLILKTAEADRERYGHVLLRLPQDPGQAGKSQAVQFKELLQGYSPIIRPITGDKATRATGIADKVNSQNVILVRAMWNPDLKEEFRRFKEDETDQQDDIVDAASDGYNELASAQEWIFG